MFGLQKVQQKSQKKSTFKESSQPTASMKLSKKGECFRGQKVVEPKTSRDSTQSKQLHSEENIMPINKSRINFYTSDKFKTEICKNFVLTGQCSFGDSCCFAHGRSELRVKNELNEQFKTKICKKFHQQGFCPYSSRCQYFHFKTNQVFQEIQQALIHKLTLRFSSPS